MNQFDKRLIDKHAFRKLVAETTGQRLEYQDGLIMQQMAGATRAHHQICSRFALLLAAQVNENDWLVMTDRGVDVGPSLRYADVVIEPAAGDPKSVDAADTALVVEVLSESSRKRDLNTKRREYLSMSTLQAYIVASQNAPLCLAWVRQEDGQFRNVATELRPGATFDVPQLAISLSIAGIYAGIDLGVAKDGGAGKNLGTGHGEDF